MASTYALPVTSTTQAHSHGHSRSLYLADPSPVWGQSNGHSHNDQGAMPYANTHDHSHQHSHERSKSLQRPKGRARGESDLGRPAERKSGSTGKFGFPPIQEVAAHPPPSSAWLELPEALTALLIPLPYFFASLAYPGIVAHGRRLPSGLGATGTQFPEAAPKETAPQYLVDGSQLLHACTLSSAMLILVGLVSKIRSSVDQPLDRRKSIGTSAPPRDTLFNISGAGRILTNILTAVLPFYATMQLGGARTAIVLLVGITAGLGGLEHKPGKHTLWDDTRRTLRTRKATCGIVSAAIVLDTLSSPSQSAAAFGYLALITWILAIPSPLPATGWSIMTGLRTADSATRASLPKPLSPLISTPEETLLTLVSGALLTVITIIFSIVSSSSPSIGYHAMLLSAVSVACATALVFFSLPSALRTQKKIGFALGILLIIAFGVLEHPVWWQAWIVFPLGCALLFGAVVFDTGTILSQAHAHDHSHSGHAHSHAHHHAQDHHLHGNHSSLSAFIINRCTPGSIAHSILIEKDSRRIAYFGMLNLAFMLVQFFYGYVSGSLGLLTDSIHMLFDCAGLAVGLAAAVMSKWPPNSSFPYGFGKVDTLSGFANGVFLMLVSVEIIFDAFERLWEGHELHRLNELLIVSILGFLVNIVGLTAFGHAHHGHGHDHGDHDHSHGHHHDNENMQGIFLHILADALGSVAVIFSTLLAKYYGWSGWDPIASCIIAILIFVSAIPLVKSAGMRLLLSLPADVEYKMRNTLQELSSLRGVVGYTVPSFWLEDEGAAHAEVHAKEHGGHDHSHTHNGHEQDDHHGHDGHSHHSHDHSEHGHSHNHDHDHDHDHDHSHAPRQQKVLGAIHIIASQAADLEDVRERTVQFLKGRGVDIVVHVEKEGDGTCWCGGSNKNT